MKRWLMRFLIVATSTTVVVSLYLAVRSGSESAVRTTSPTNNIAAEDRHEARPTTSQPTVSQPDESRPSEPAESDDLVPLDTEINQPLTPPPDPAGPEIDATGSLASGREILHVVYFIEQDREFDPESLELINQQTATLQTYWYAQFGGTFHLAEGGVAVVYGDHDSAWYEQTEQGDDSRWFRLINMRNEIMAKLALDPSDRSVRMITYPTARIDGRVGANRYGGAWMDGDDIGCIDGRVSTTPYTPDYPASCLATVAHELGHIYGLGHTGEESDCMQFGFYLYVIGTRMCDFSDENRSAIINDPNNQGWLDASPGDRR